MRFIEFAGWAIDTSLLATGLLVGAVWFATGFLFGKRAHRCPLPDARVFYPAPRNVDPDELRARIVAGHRPVRLSEKPGPASDR